MDSGLPPAVVSRIPGWRRQFRHLYRVDIGGDPYVFRPLSWNEFRELKEKMDGAPLAGKGIGPIPAEVATTAVLWPNELPETMTAGGFWKLIETIFEASGFGQESAFDEAVAAARAEVGSNLDDLLISMICKAFPYKPEDLEKKTFLELMKLFALAEKILDASLVMEDANQGGTMAEAGQTNPQDLDRLFQEIQDA